MLRERIIIVSMTKAIALQHKLQADRTKYWCKNVPWKTDEDAVKIGFLADDDYFKKIYDYAKSVAND